MCHQLQMSKYPVLGAHARGLFKSKKLPYGRASAPVELQGMMDGVLEQLNGVICYVHGSGRDQGVSLGTHLLQRF